MDQLHDTVKAYIEGAGWFAPVLFIILHLIRPLFLFPVIVICIIGGVLFGFVAGAILSFIGLTLLSIEVYWLANHFPKFKERLDRLKDKFFKDSNLSLGQVMVLRIMPFIHFNLLNLYVMEMTKTFKTYVLYTLAGMIAPAILYTAFGHIIVNMSWLTLLMMFVLLAAVYYALSKHQKSRMQPEPNGAD